MQNLENKASFETALLMWLGWISVVLALVGLIVSLFNPVALILSCVALILGGVSTVAGTSRLGKVVGVIIAVNIVAVAYLYPPSSDSSLFRFIAIVFTPAYLIAYALSQIGRWRLRNAIRLNADQSDESESEPESEPEPEPGRNKKNRTENRARV